MEDLFVTRDGGETFCVMEDERGDIYWGYGHVEPEAFIAEMDRYLRHTGNPSRNTVEGLAAVGVVVEHLWARQSGEERFDIVELTCTEADAFTFPVTRLMF